MEIFCFFVAIACGGVIILVEHWAARLIACIVLIICVSVLKEDDVKHQLHLQPVDISVYHAIEAQTDSTPFITADGSTIDPRNLQQWAAVSRDQLAAYPFGSTFILRCKCPYDGIEWEVHDVMNARYSTSVDLLVSNLETGKWEGIIHKP